MTHHSVPYVWRITYRGFQDLSKILNEGAFRTPQVLNLPSSRSGVWFSNSQKANSSRSFQHKNSGAAPRPGNCPDSPCDMLRYGWCHVALICARFALSVATPGVHRGVRNAAAPLCVRPGEHTVTQARIQGGGGRSSLPIEMAPLGIMLPSEIRCRP